MSSQVLSGLYSAISTSIYDELRTRQTNLYTFIGDVTGLTQSETRDTLNYEMSIRDKMVYAKRIPMSDISYVVPRINWTTGTVYDQYEDDYYGGSVIDIDISNGGSGYTESNTSVYVVGGGGTGTELTPNVVNGEIISVAIEQSGVGYYSAPTVVIVGDGTGAVATSSISGTRNSTNGFSSLKDCLFYVITDAFNVYKCLYNNLGVSSTVKPVHTTIDPYETADGYVWKFMYHIPLALRKKFLTSSFMPVYNLATSSNYNNGSIEYVEIINGGSGYNVSTPIRGMICGNCHSASFSVKTNQYNEISSFDIVEEGSCSASFPFQIKSIVRSGTTVTVTTFESHNLLVGRSVVVANSSPLNNDIDGTYVVSSIIDKNTFTYNTTTSGAVALLEGARCYLPSSATFNIASLTRVDNTATVVTTVPHKFGNALTITISGVADFNGSYVVQEIISATSFIITSFGDDNAVLATGTVSQSQHGISGITRNTNVVTVTTKRSHNFYAPITITNITRTSNVVTINMSREEYFNVGDTIIIEGTVAFNGTFTVASVVDGDTITFNAVGADSIENFVGTIYCQAVIANCHVTAYNGTFKVTGTPSQYIFTYDQTAANDTTYSNTYYTFTTIPAVDSTSAASGAGKYLTNVYPDLLTTPHVMDGIGYTVAPLLYIKGTTGTGANFTVDGVSGGSITTTTKVSAGSGYTSEPKVYIKGGSPNQAVVTANIVGNQVTSYTVVSGGFGYKEAPEIIIKVDAGTAPTAVATVVAGAVTAVTPVTLGSGIGTADVYFYDGKNDYVIFPKASLWHGTVDNLYIRNKINLVAIRDPGINFSNGEIASIISTGDGANARFTPHILNGAIDAVTIDDPGEGYTYIDLAVTGDTGTGAKLKGIVSEATNLGQINTSQFDVELLAVDGAISSIIVDSVGMNTTSQAVTITGNGTGATAYGYVNGSNKMTKIKVTNPGSGYTHATVSFTDDTNYVIHVNIAPLGGHGSNAISELFSDKLMTYTKLSSTDLYKDFGINSEYYNYGLLANPRTFVDKKKSLENLTSPCYKVTSATPISHALFPIGEMMYIYGDGNYNYYQIAEHLDSSGSSSMSVLVIDIDNYGLRVSDILTSVSSDIITISALEEPGIDKLSGTLLDINNTSVAFYQSPPQIISLRTIISL